LFFRPFLPTPRHTTSPRKSVIISRAEQSKQAWASAVEAFNYGHCSVTGFVSIGRQRSNDLPVASHISDSFAKRFCFFPE
jgi:hypothetical protein